MKITGRRRRRALAANPASKEPGASVLKRLAAVRVHRFVRRRHFLFPFDLNINGHEQIVRTSIRITFAVSFG